MGGHGGPGVQNRVSRRGNCYGKAQAEPFWNQLKTALLDGGRFAWPAEARFGLAHYIACSNTERRHSGLDYQSPSYFETHFQATPPLCLLQPDHLTVRARQSVPTAHPSA